jgi:Glycosyl transferase family 2
MADLLARILVVIPVHDEEELLPGCLDALEGAMARLAASEHAVPVRPVVVLDRCTDGSERIARARAVLVAETDAGQVGAARRTGVAAGLAASPGVPLTRTWIASTDADSRVPAEWLVEHARHARDGVDLLLGAVVPSVTDVSAGLLRRWRELHPLPLGPEHVFGANLGIRASAYRDAGGFPLIASGEDVALVAALRRLGVHERRAHRFPVVTSGRMAGRAPSGFARYLADLSAEGLEEPVEPAS